MLGSGSTDWTGQDRTAWTIRNAGSDFQLGLGGPNLMAADSEALQEAHEYRINGQYDEAIDIYRQVLGETPEQAEALWGLGLSLMNSGDFDVALEKICQAADLEPENQLYLLDAGKHYTMLGMYDEARPFFEKVVALDPASKHGSEAQKQLSYYE